jgi:hypothetical protein
MKQKTHLINNGKTKYAVCTECSSRYYQEQLIRHQRHTHYSGENKGQDYWKCHCGFETLIRQVDTSKSDEKIREDKLNLLWDLMRSPHDGNPYFTEEEKREREFFVTKWEYKEYDDGNGNFRFGSVWVEAEMQNLPENNGLRFYTRRVMSLIIGKRGSLDASYYNNYVTKHHNWIGAPYSGRQKVWINNKPIIINYKKKNFSSI